MAQVRRRECMRGDQRRQARADSLPAEPAACGERAGHSLPLRIAARTRYRECSRQPRRRDIICRFRFIFRGQAMAKKTKAAVKKGSRVKRIDVHSHVVPRELLEALTRDPERYKMRYVSEGRRHLAREALDGRRRDDHRDQIRIWPRS